MISFIRKFSIPIFIITFFFSFTVPALAQSTLFDEPLGAIKEKVDVVDYSEGGWGALPQEIIDVLGPEGEGYTSLDNLAEQYKYHPEFLYDEPEDIPSTEAEKRLLLQERLDTMIADLEAMTYIDGTPFEDEDVSRIINEFQYRGESQINTIVMAVAKVMRNLLGAIAIIWIIVAGILMVMARGDESKITEQKRAITYAMIGLVVILVLERLIVAVYGVPGVVRGITPEAAAEGISMEIYGLISFIKALIGAVAILMIVISGLKTIAAQGEEEKITKQRKAVLWIIIGIVIIVVNQVVVENLYIRPVQETAGEITKTNVENIIGLFGRVTQFILGFVGLVAFAALVYGAAQMIMNYSNEEMVNQSKKIIKNALIGIIVIVSAFAIVSTIII